jgi:hypothetical protein
MPELLYRAIRDFAKGQHERVRSTAVQTPARPAFGLNVVSRG